VIGVTVTHDETNAPLGDDEGLEGAESSVTPDADPAPAGERESAASEEDQAGVEVVEAVEAEPEAGYVEDDEDEEPFVLSPYDQPGRWFVVHTYAGYENKVKSNLHSRAVSMNMEDRIYEVVIPMEDVVEFKNGKKVVVQKKVFPGYLLCRCEPRRRQLGRLSGTRPASPDSWGRAPSRPLCHGARSKASSRSRWKAGKPPPSAAVPVSSTRSARRCGQGRTLCRLLGPDRRNQRGPAEAQGPGQHFWSRDPSGTRIQPGREAVGRRDQVRRSTECHRRSASSRS